MTTPEAMRLTEVVKRLAFEYAHASTIAGGTFYRQAETAESALNASIDRLAALVSPPAQAPDPEALHDDRLTVAAIAMAARVKLLPLMQAAEAAGEGSVTANQKLTMDQALQAIAAIAPPVVAEPCTAEHAAELAGRFMIPLRMQFDEAALRNDCEALARLINYVRGNPAPAQQPLTEKQIDAEWAAAGKRGIGHMATYLQAREFARAIEAAVHAQPQTPTEGQS